MKVPISWLKDFVEITIPIEDLARKLTLAGLEVDEVRYVGYPLPAGRIEGQTSAESRLEINATGIEWAADKIVVAWVSEVLPHPNADRLVLCKLEDGEQEHVVLTGAPNLFPYKGIGPLEKPLKVAYAREGAQIYDGHQPGQVLTTLKRARIRGFDSYSMICSEKELGISEDHEGVIFLDEDAPLGTPLVDYMGDAVLDISILPNTARAASILGVAREVAALTGVPLKDESGRMKDESGKIKDEGGGMKDEGGGAKAEGQTIEGRISIEITNPELNPRFVLGLIENVEICPSPYWVQRRLKLAGMRPINNIVDATNYAMLEIGEPLHAFDYDVLVGRIANPPHEALVGRIGNRPHKVPKIITRTAGPGEKLTTLDKVERTLDEKTVLVCDTAGPLSIAGVMGGAESEVSEKTRDILLEGAAWNFTNIRRTARAQNLPSEASFRFSRGVHPALAERGVRRGLELMRQWADGVVAHGLVDNYPLPPAAPTVEIAPEDVKRWLGIDLSAEEIIKILASLEFHCELTHYASRITVRATAPDHRLDISEGIIGKADLLEEIARIYGYDRIPETRLSDELPPQRSNPGLEREERIRDLLVKMGLQEVVSYRMTSIEREARLGMNLNPAAYVQLAKPIASDRCVMRQSLLSSVMEVVERNARIRTRMALFEIGPVFLASQDDGLPDEPQRLAIVLTGPHGVAGWQPADTAAMDFYDLKGILAVLLEELHVGQVSKPDEIGYGNPTYVPHVGQVSKPDEVGYGNPTYELHGHPTYALHQHPTFHPGKCARLMAGEREIGVFGELHPQVRQNYDLPTSPLLAAELDLDALLSLIPERYESWPVPAYPPVLEDLALVVDESLPAERLAEVIRQAGGKILADVRLFDLYRGEKIGAGKKSLAYSLTYQAPDKTLTDKDVAGIRTRILRRLEQELGATLRS
ncbi:MAG: phenylalanine--tRNA ligase subunit beta [Anaerolineales bacterium]|nr:phenylalanine--tRNA ligase subunit beta [Anaerolineales bacterium]